MTLERGLAQLLSEALARDLADLEQLKVRFISPRQYWLNHEVEDEATFRSVVRDVCKLYHQAQELHEQGVHIGSRDEKTGIQALERDHPTHPMEPGKPEAVEYEYERHGTQALIANFEVAFVQVISPTVGDTRTFAPFVEHIVTTVETDPEAQWIFVCDQLNIHKAALYAQAIAQLCFISDDLGIKGKSGILHNMDTRATLSSRNLV